MMTLLMLPFLIWQALLDTIKIDSCAIALVLAGLTYMTIVYGTYVVIV